MKQTLLFLISFVAISLNVYGNHFLDPPSEAPLPVDITIPLVDDVSCHGASDGSATIVIAGLSLLTSYSYEVTNSEDEVIQSGDEALLEDLISDLLDLDAGLTIRVEDLPAGTYTFSWTTDPLIGGPTTQSIDFTVEEPPALEIIDLSVDDIVSCIDPTGSIEVITSGGTGDLLGILNLGEVLNLGQDGNTITDLSEGVYSIIIEDENGCRDTASAEVENLIELPNLDVTGSLELGCHELIDLGVAADEGVELTVDVPNLDTDVEVIDETFEVTTPGIYTFTALDPLTGCVSEEEVEVTADVEVPLLDAGTDRILGCLDNLELEAVTDATSIVWENLSGNVLTSNQILEVGSPGTYVAVASDPITGCEARDTVIVSPGDEDDNSVLDFDAGVTYDLGCLDVADLVLINNDGIEVDFDILGDAGEIIAGDDNKLTVGEPGTYVVSGVSLVTGCLVSDTINVTANVTIGTIDIEQDTIYLDCDGTAVITADDSDLGAGGNAEVLWEVIEGEVLIDENGTSANVEGAGMVAVVATDLIKECTTSDTVVLVNPGDVAAEGQVTNAVCVGEDNGDIDLTILGGVGPYTYAWSNGAATQDISGLAAGSYTVMVTDSRGCAGEFTFAVENPDQPMISVDVTPGDGDSFTVQAVVQGGEGPYTYAWSTGSDAASISVEPGDYSLVVTDANGCSNSLDFQVTSDPDDPDDPDNPSDSCNLVLDFVTTLVMDSADATAQVFVSGGVEPYTYVWSTGDTTPAITGLSVGVYEVTVTDSAQCSESMEVTIEEDPDDGGPEGCPEDIVVDQCNSMVTFSEPDIVTDMDYTITQIEGWCSGSVFPIGTTRITYLIVYENGEYDLCSFNITVIPVDLDFEVTMPSCYGAADGQVVVNVPDPDKDYYLFWDKTPIQKNDTLTDLTAGTYRLIGMDDSGCIINNEITLHHPDSLIIQDGMLVNSSDSIADGQVHIAVHGGTYPYTYEWQGPNGFSSSQEDLYGVPNGEYTLTVVDANGCSLVAGPYILEGDSDVIASEFPKFNQGVTADQVKMYPNPSEGMVSFEIRLDNQSDINVTIYNSIGKLVKEHAFEKIHESTVDINLSDLNKGTYFINIQTHNGLLTKTITLF